MTLREWALETKAYVGTHANGSCWVPAWQVNSDKHIWHLFHLNDYIVSSYSAGTYWLIAA